MQKRHLDRLTYFHEMANTSCKYYLNYLEQFLLLEKNDRILEIGCGEGGNLLPFSERECHVTGIDRSADRIRQAKEFFALSNRKGEFITCDFFDIEPTETDKPFDVVLIHDVIEHIHDKDRFLKHLQKFVHAPSVIFWGFPAWHMPFGGHQQICRNKICASLPFIHLLPNPIYRTILKIAGENERCINELLDIKSCGVSIEHFEKLLRINKYSIIERKLWFINPHYEQKFDIRPRYLYAFIERIKYIRNMFCTSCFYLTRCTGDFIMTFNT